MFIDRIIAKRATLPVFISFISEILQNTRPAVYVAALCDSWGNHLRQVFKTYRALDIACVDNVEYDLNYILPLHCFIGIVQIKHVVVASLDYKLKGRLNVIVLHWPVAFTRSPFTFLVIGIGIARVLRIVIILIGKTQ